MKRNTLDKIQTWCDVAAVGIAVAMVIDSAISRNFPAMGGWLCAAIWAVSAGMAHGDVRFWRKRYIDELEKNLETEKGENK